MRVLAVAAFLLALAPSIAGAQLPDPPPSPSDADVAQARDRFVRGMELAQREQWAAALEEFERSYALSGSPAALFNMGSTYRSLHRFLEARAAFDRLLGDNELDEETRRAAEAMRTDVSAQVASVTVDGVPSGPASVAADGEERPPTEARPIEIELDPGRRTLAIRVPEHAPWTWEGAVAPGAQLHLDAELAPLPSTSTAGGADPLPWLLAGAGGIVAGLIVGLVVADLEAQLDPRTSLVITLP